MLACSLSTWQPCRPANLPIYVGRVSPRYRLLSCIKSPLRMAKNDKYTNATRCQSLKGIAIPSTLYRKSSRVTFKNDSVMFVVIHADLATNRNPPNRIDRRLMRSRRVAAASGGDLCGQVAALDWRRPTQCPWTLSIKRRVPRSPLHTLVFSDY